ncbi:MAG: hypothetical protein AAB447_01395 [Patescibacteria group bacterium]
MKIIQKISRVSFGGVTLNVVRLRMSGIKLRPKVLVSRQTNSR